MAMKNVIIHNIASKQIRNHFTLASLLYHGTHLVCQVEYLYIGGKQEILMMSKKRVLYKRVRFGRVKVKTH